MRARARGADRQGGAGGAASRWPGRLRYTAAAALSTATAPPLAAGLVARYVSPDVLWWPQLAALALPALALASAPSAAWLWWTASQGRPPAGGALRLAGRSLASLQGALVLVACAQYAADRVPAGSDAPSPSGAVGEPERGDQGGAGPRELTVVSLNVGQGPTRPQPLADLLGALRPDVVALQEATLRVVAVADAPGGAALAAPPSVSALVSHPSYRLATPGVAGALPPEGTPVQNPVFVRADRVGRAASPASDGGSVSLGSGGSPGTYTRAVVEWDGRPVAVYSVHLRSFGRWRQAPRPPGLAGLARYGRRALGGLRRDLVSRAAEADRLRAVLDAEPLPYLVAGDLNSTPAQWAYRRVAERSGDALALRGGPYPRTFPARSPLVRIDAVLAGPAFDVVAASVGPAGLSDHRPVVATVRVRSAPRAAGGAVFSVPGSPTTGGAP